jgi:hypothetical protein
MCVRFFITVAAFAAVAGSLDAQTRRAALIDDGGNRGKCTVEVVVDGAVEVEVRGDVATMRNLSGQQPQWRRFECNRPMPPNPVDFRFAGVDGRGRQELVRDPRNGGVAVIRIEDPESGSEAYTFDLFWDSGNRGPMVPAVPDRRGDYRDNLPLDRGRNVDRRFTTDQAVRVCQDAIRQQASNQFRTPNITFRATALDNNPGRNDWVVGSFDVRRGYNRDETYRFSCSVNFDTGQVRSAQIDPIGGGGVAPGNPAYNDRNAPGYNDRNAPGYNGRNAPAYGADRARPGLQSCARAVEQRLRRDGYYHIEVGAGNVEDRPGGTDFVTGTARAETPDYYPESFDFSCAVNLESGVVRSVDVRRR